MVHTAVRKAGRIAENWERVMQAVSCPICGAVKGAPCINPYGMVFEGKGHTERRSKYYIERKRKASTWKP